MNSMAIEAVIREAGEIIACAKHPKVFEKEGHANFVTQTDQDVQDFLIHELSLLMPEAKFLAEEKENAVLDDSLTFIIDPIDGTTNFMHARECSAISVGIVEKREPVMAFVYQPWRKDLYFAQKGEGAFLNGQPIHVSPLPLSQAVVNVGTSPYREELRKRSMSLCGLFLEHAADIRRCGSAALDLCDVACGKAEVFWELELSPWDYAAGALLVTEAGGRIGNCEGGPLQQGGKSSVLAANSECFEQALALF
ncbi:MAG: inositol monophosphatase family protein [Eubacteriales bacterium]|nr:inositol monophosphatase family protein [Eubacteriales bacterium]